MPLTKRKFTAGDQARTDVQSFDCGDSKLDRDATQFLINEAPNLIDDPDNPLDVWLYYDQDGSLVGFSSLGRSEWSYPRPTGLKTAVQIIPYVAVSKAHQQKGHGNEIFDDLIVEAIARRDKVSDLLGLLVHVDNPVAIHIYEKAGFTKHGKPSTYDGEKFQRMIVRLP